MGSVSSTPVKRFNQKSESRIGRIQLTGRYHRLKPLSADYYLQGKVLGSGYNGKVFAATSKTNGALVAVKALTLIGTDPEKREELHSECEIFLAMDHPHVARLKDVYQTSELLIIVMECMTGGELFDRVVSLKRFSERTASDAAYQMLLAVNYIHSHGIVHRDLKLENFLYETEGSDHLKLIDFGFSKIFEPNRKMAASCGTLAYVAPEVLNQSYTCQCDMWSYGVTVFIILFGYMPFAGAESRQVRLIKEGNFTYKAHIWENVSTDGQDFVRKLLVVNPGARMTPDQALAHPWLAEREARAVGSVDQGIVDALCSFGQASAFRKACLSMMAWSLSVDERSKVRDAFLELDSSRTGAITLSEFKMVLADKFSLEEDEISTVFKALDTDQSDEIHYSEFLAAMVSSKIAIHDQLLKDTFQRFDIDNSGSITVENLRNILGESFGGTEVDTILDEADLTRDGKVSYAEFIKYLKDGVVADRHADAADRVIDSELKKNSVPRADTHWFMERLMRTASNLGDEPVQPDVEVPAKRRQNTKCTCVLS